MKKIKKNLFKIFSVKIKNIFKKENNSKNRLKIDIDDYALMSLEERERLVYKDIISLLSQK